jgi:hypothetical protein
MLDFTSLLHRFQWKEMRNCPGRYILAGAPSTLLPHDLVPGAALREYTVQSAPDTVVVARFDGGGLISYKKPDGHYLHTLNTNEGLERKLQQLGILFSD